MTSWLKRKIRGNEVECDPNADPFAVFSSVSLKAGEKQILKDLTLSLRERRIGIIGLNGSGKSSFVRLLNGLRQPATGQLTLFGVPAEQAGPELPRHVGFVFQNPDHQAIFPTVEEEIAFGLSQLGADKTESRSRARSFLADHDCEQLADRPFAELSEGQKQLICILSVLVMEPKVLILDEPMTSLDALSTRRIRDKILSLPQKIVMISHDLSHFDGFDRLIWLEDGQLRDEGPPGEMIAAYERDIELRAGIVAEVAAL